MPGVLVFVCLLATILKNCRTDLYENFTVDISVHKEELIKFWKSLVSGSGFRNVLKNSSILRDGAFFPQFGLYRN